MNTDQLLSWADVPALRRAAPTQPVREAAGAFEDEDRGYRSLSGVSKRDLSSLSQDQMQRLASYLWETNLLANRLIELPLAYLVAEGVRLTCADEEHQRWLDAFWHDPINKMDLRLPTFVRELALFGEQCWPTYVNEMNGHVRLGYLDPSLIDVVITDPGNAAQEIGVRTVKDAAGAVRRFRVVVRGEDDELFAAQARQMRAEMDSGDAFYFAVNKYAAGRRGRSDLLAQLDWLDAYDEFLFDQLERAAELDAFIWDVELTGATEEDVRKRAAEIKRPGRGAVRVHNDQEKWTAEAPNLNAVDRAESARMFRNHALGGATLPEHWFGGGGDVNRASASEMGDPFFKVATMRQTTWRHILVELGQYQLYQRARAMGQTPDWGDPAWQVRVAFPEMVTKDVAKLAAALQSCVVACASALGEKLISRKTALQIIATAAARMDVEIDPEKELAAAEADAPEPEGGAAPGAAKLGVPPDLEDGGDGNPQA
ncbi:MAG: hypothetical protein E6Q67_13000 [Roseateles sp.]|nr:MAG: hypothetical protein E6Q67_13000 [Roseateles sp.]